jgi:long-subunit acyl-CoA synthetase (AMP-forming)
MQALKPTLFPSVPRLLNRFHDGVQVEKFMAKIKLLKNF